MNKAKKLLVIMLLLLFCISVKSYAKIDIQQVEYSDEYKQWYNLPEEEKSKLLEPRKYSIKICTNNNTSNLLKVSKMLRSSLNSKYSLKDVIGENVKVKNQGDTNMCWAFATLSSLETNLALRDLKSNNETKEYDFSERHMAYSSIREFLNNEVNTYGHNTSLNLGGNYLKAFNYLSNGLGAIDEENMPFENNENIINLSEIKDKKCETTLIDAEIFATPTNNEEKLKITQEAKEHITNYGSIYAGIHGATLNSEYYNNDTGAIYCNNSDKAPINHAVSIIGWDDNYNKENFSETCRPNQNGAWIIKNSWGEYQEYSISSDLKIFKENFFSQCKPQCISNGWNTAQDIPDNFMLEVLKEIGFIINEQEDSIKYKIGDNGLMYISYEDVNVLSLLSGIVKAKAEKDYDNIYQYDKLGANCVNVINSNKAYIANIFTRDSSKKEVLTKVSLSTFGNYNYKVLINPNGDSLRLKDLQEIKLAEGNYETLGTGYHTIEFAAPIRLNGDKFAIVIQIEGGETQNKYFWSEGTPETQKELKYVEINEGESFCTDENGMVTNEWQDLKILGNACIKAFTNEIEEEKVALESISILNPPNKTQYKVGETFDTTGMIVEANYNDGTHNQVDDYTIVEGLNIISNQTYITISYTEKEITKTVKQSITVTKGQDEKYEPGNDDKDPTASEFSNVSAKITEANMHFYTQKTKKENLQMKIEIDNIKLGNLENEYVYYYYLSGEQKKLNISDDQWISVVDKKVNEQGIAKLILQVNTENLQNADDIAEFENLYIFIKEIASINGKETITEQKPILVALDCKTKVFVDDEYKGTLDEFTQGKFEETIEKSTQTVPANETNDDTVAKKSIPNTGIRYIIIITTLILVSGILGYYKYKKTYKEM